MPGEPANTEIYVANNDGDLTGPDVKRLTFNKGLLPSGTLSGIAGTDFSPSWSGTQITFHSGRTTTSTDGGTTPTNETNDFEIYKMSSTVGEDVTPATRLTVNRGQDAIPSWSPDGTKIAFQAFPPGNPPTLNNNLEIFTINPDGTGRTNVSNNPGTPNDPATPANENLNGLDRDVIWSPDSQQIAYNSARASAVPGNQNNDVYRANRDGSGRVRLTPDADAPSPAAFTDYDAPLVWSPDGTKILFASSFESTLTTNDFFAYTMSAVTGDTGPASVQKVARVEQFQRCDWTTPQPALPGPATGGGTPTGGGVAIDKTPPTVTLSGVPASMSLKAFLKGVKAKVGRNEASSIVATLEGSARKTTLAAAFNLSLASKSVRLGTGSSTVLLKPSKSLVGRAKKLRARVRVVVTDAAGNRRTVTKSIKVK